MTSLDRHVAPAGRLGAAPPTSAGDHARVVGLAAVAGVLLGAGDLWFMTHVPFPWADLANSSAVWAVAAFLLALALRVGAARSAVAGAVMLVVAVEAYYVVAILQDRADPQTLREPSTQSWMVSGVAAGGLLGAAGAWALDRSAWRAALGWALGAGVLLGEALHDAVHVHLVGAQDTVVGRTAAALAVLGLVLLAGAARRPVVLVGAVLAAVPVTLAAAVAFSAVGIGF